MKTIALTLVIALLSACSSLPKTYIDYDRAHNFAAYKTFSWAHSPPLISDGDTRLTRSLEHTATDSIKAGLERQGFSFVNDQSDADFLVAYTVGSRKNVQINPTEICVYSNKDNWLWGKQHHSYYFDVLLHEDLKGSFSKGVIALDIFDAKNRTPVWHSKISKTASNKNLTQLFSDRQELSILANKLTQKFPPK